MKVSNTVLQFPSAIQARANGSESAEKSIEVQGLNDFEVFFKELKKEAKAEGMTEELSEDDAREMFQMWQHEYQEGIEFDNDVVDGSQASRQMFEGEQDSYSDEDANSDDDIDWDEDSDSDKEEETTADQRTAQLDDDLVVDFAEEGRNRLTITEPDLNRADFPLSLAEPKVASVPGLAELDGLRELTDVDDSELYRIKDLAAALPGMPIGRIKKVAKAFENTLGYPSLLTLVPLLRETLPDFVTLQYLKQLNQRNAEFVLQRAEQDGLVDQGVLNAMLQVKTSAKSLDEAENFHRNEFRRHNLVSSRIYFATVEIPIEPRSFAYHFQLQKPTEYSDRLVFQMLVESHTISRALDFKRRIESEKRTLDLASYGTLIDYYGSHKQLGSSICLLKECVVVHGTPPSQKYLSSTRLLAQQLEMHDELGLNELLGKDPIAWLKHGERHLKREKSYKGRRDVKWVYNRLLS